MSVRARNWFLGSSTLSNGCTRPIYPMKRCEWNMRCRDTYRIQAWAVFDLFASYPGCQSFGVHRLLDDRYPVAGKPPWTTKSRSNSQVYIRKGAGFSIISKPSTRLFWRHFEIESQNRGNPGILLPAKAFQGSFLWYFAWFKPAFSHIFKIVLISLKLDPYKIEISACPPAPKKPKDLYWQNKPPIEYG